MEVSGRPEHRAKDLNRHDGFVFAFLVDVFIVILRHPKNKSLGFVEIVWVRLCNSGFKLRSFAEPQDDSRLRLRVDLGSFM
jgi:hypothetical protein